MRKQRGFTLIELLIVVAIIGIIAAIAIPNLLDAIERSRQKRSTAEVKTIAEALQAFSTDYKGYPDNGESGDPSVKLSSANYQDAASSPAFCPDYLQAIPNQDGWGTAYVASFGPDSASANVALGKKVAGHFTLGSLGNDRTASASGADKGAASFTTIADNWSVTVPSNAGTLQTHCYMTDIVWGDSSFLQAPEGKQKNC
jgi:general secretion pathway protein G